MTTTTCELRGDCNFVPNTAEPKASQDGDEPQSVRSLELGQRVGVRLDQPFEVWYGWFKFICKQDQPLSVRFSEVSILHFKKIKNNLVENRRRHQIIYCELHQRRRKSVTA